MAPYDVALDELTNTMSLAGAIQFDNVTKIRDKGLKIINSLTTINVDLAEVTLADSSALSLLLAWQRDAQGQGKTIQYHNLPQQLLDLGQFNGLNLVLPIFIPKTN